MTNKILIIDDNKDILFAMAAICDYENWISYIAANVTEGLKILIDKKPDIILIDYHMPLINGIEGVKKIRKIDKCIPIIVLTIEEDQRVADRFIAAGASDFALKPIKAPDIISRINVHLRFMESIGSANRNFDNYTKGVSIETLDLIKKYMNENEDYNSINDIAENTDLANQTVHRYMQYMECEDLVDVEFKYGKVGRPQKWYRLRLI